jgi:sugar phosphate isomerase/epimerase
MARTILFPITRNHVDEAIGHAPELARQARALGANVLVLQTECLHGLLTGVDEDDEELEARRIHELTERVADAVRNQGVAVEVAWECVQAPRRPVDAATVRRHGADAVFAPSRNGLGGIIGALTLRRLRRHGIAVLRPDRQAVHT